MARCFGSSNVFNGLVDAHSLPLRSRCLNPRNTAGMERDDAGTQFLARIIDPRLRARSIAAVIALDPRSGGPRLDSATEPGVAVVPSVVGI
jgi:hypothetical protein